MRRSVRGTRRSARIAAALAAVLGAAILGTGCAATTTSEAGTDTNRGKELFTQKCGGCHTLADAGSLGQTGPNLDHAFGPSRDQGFEQSTFFEATLEQMRVPGNGSPMPDFDNEDDKDNYLSDEDLENVAAYVAAVAGLPPQQGGGGTDTGSANDPKSLFVASCGSCHTLDDAGTSGTTGPNLDDAKPALEEAIRQIANGGGGMPPFKDQLSEEQIRALAQYIVDSTSRR